MRFKLFLIALFTLFAFSAQAATRVGHDLIIFGKRGSNFEKDLYFGDQFRLQTSSATGELLLSVNSGGDYSPILTASVGGGGGGPETPSSVIDRSAAIFNGTDGASLTSASLTFNLDGDATFDASVTVTASLSGTDTASSIWQRASDSEWVINGQKILTELDSVGGGGTSLASTTVTVSAGFGTISKTSHSYMCTGNVLFGWGTFRTGTVSAVLATLTIPSGFTMDNDFNYVELNFEQSDLGRAIPIRNNTASHGDNFAVLFARASDTDKLFFDVTANNANQFNGSNVTDFTGTNEGFSFHYRIPVTSCN